MPLNYPQFFKPDPNKPLVVDINGNPVSYEQYIQLTGQTGVSPAQVNWSYVTKGNPADTQAVNSLKQAGFSDAQISSIPADMKLGLAAFWDAQQSALNKGGVAANDINQQTFNDAMKAAANDPSIAQKYGEGLQVAAQSLGNNLGLLTGQYTQEQAANQRNFVQQQKELADAAASAGQAYSGFREQAKQKLGAEQNDIVQSSRRQLQQSLQGLVGPFEQRFGTQQLQQTIGNTPGIMGEATYTPYGNLQGTESLAKKADVENKAQSLYPLGLNPAK